MTQEQKERLQHHIDVMQAQIEGKKIQVKYMSLYGEYSDWYDVDHDILKFDWQHNDYRISQ